MRRPTLRRTAATAALGLCAIPGAAALSGAPSAEAASTTFKLVRSQTAVAADCLEGATANVSVSDVRGVQRMTIWASYLPPRTTFVVWVNQVPNAPFGASWYLGDVTTDASGQVSETFVGRFNVETFVVAPGSAPAPRTHTAPPFPDASSNPSFKNVHMYHVGLWFDSPELARTAHCPDATTPFNGDHTAGVQAMSTRNFPALAGPLSRLQ